MSDRDNDIRNFLKVKISALRSQIKISYMTTGQSKEVQFFILTEATFFMVILTIIKGTMPIVLFCDPLFPPLGIILERFRRILISLGLSNSLASSFDDCPWPPSFPIEKNFTHGVLAPVLNPLQENLLPKQNCKRLNQ